MGGSQPGALLKFVGQDLIKDEFKVVAMYDRPPIYGREIRHAIRTP